MTDQESDRQELVEELTALRQRVSALKANADLSLTIMPAEGGGTAVLCVLPLESGEQD